MKYTLLLSLLLVAMAGKSQIFWTENFNNGCTSSCTTYSGPNGAWNITSTGTNDPQANVFYISCAENGHTDGVCGTGCVAQTATATLATLHMGATSDNGASYNAGGLCVAINICVQTNRRAESPVINCTGHSNITLKFNYIEGGDGTNDNATLWYYDGSSWTQLSDPAKTPPICPGGQGMWTAYSIALPASANNNPNVKIGFNWTNNDDGTGTDPSFAVDSVTLSTAAAAGPPVAAFSISPSDTVCLGQCLSFTDQSTNSPTSWAWDFTGATPATSAVQNPGFVCYTAPGTYTVKLTATNASGSDTETHKIVVHALPHPTLTVNGHNLTLPNGGLYTGRQWYKNGSIYTGFTNATLSVTVNGSYYIRITDTNGCTGNSDTVTISDLAVRNVNSFEANVALYPNPNNGTFTLKGNGFYENTVWMEVTDIAGRLVQQEKLEPQNGNIDRQISLSKDIVQGMYMLKLSSSEHRYVLSFRKE
jgi:PKD repeat protein